MLTIKKTLTMLMGRLLIDWNSANVQHETRGGANPFTVNHDGWLTGWVNNIGATSNGIYIRVNGKEVATIPSTISTVNTTQANVPVQKGDTVEVRVIGAGQGYGIDIYPFVGGVIRGLLSMLIPERGWAMC